MTAALEGGEWSAARPGRTLPPGKTRYPFYRRLGGPQSRAGRGGKSGPHRDSIPDRPARSRSLCRLTYRAQVNSDVIVPEEKQDGLSACFIFVMDFIFIAIIHNALDKIKFSRAFLVVKSVRLRERSVQRY